MKLFEVACLLVAVGVSSAYPRSKYYPRSYMVGGSFYNPRYVREGPGYEYLTPGQMTAMVVGDTVATSSFSGSPVYGAPPRNTLLSVPNPEIGQFEDDERSEQVTEKQQPILIPVPEPDSINETEPEEISEQPQNINGEEQETLFSVDATTEAVAIPTTKVVPSRAPSAARKSKNGGKAKRPTPAPVAPVEPADDDEEEDAGSWPFGAAGRSGLPNYNAFFPIFIGGSQSSRSRTRSGEGQVDSGYPGSATAIANSFSTGKGGVATSHATSFGDPYAAAMMRNAGLFNFRAKGNKKNIVRDEEEE